METAGPWLNIFAEYSQPLKLGILKKLLSKLLSFFGARVLGMSSKAIKRERALKDIGQNTRMSDSHYAREDVAVARPANRCARVMDRSTRFEAILFLLPINDETSNCKATVFFERRDGVLSDAPNTLTSWWSNEPDP